ncbi:hypothetical protein [Candidatus Nitrosocosmicus sp. R]
MVWNPQQKMKVAIAWVNLLYSTLSYSPSVLPMAPNGLAAIFSLSPNVCPLSVDTLATGRNDVLFLSHQGTIMFPPSADISAFTESELSVLLTLVISRPFY